LIAGAVVPMVGFAAYLAAGLSRTQQEAIERGLIEATHALVSSVDHELESTTATLQALATSQSLDRGDYRAFVAGRACVF
jgi:hypothetical protein